MPMWRSTWSRIPLLLGHNRSMQRKSPALRSLPSKGLGAVVLICALVTPALASAPERMLPDTLRVDRIGTSRGLPSEIVSTLLVDRFGFLWIGTRDGLAMYDGYSARVYQYIANDPDSVSGNDIRAIMEDREGRLWVGTTSGGLNLLDRATGRFTHYRHDPNDPTSLSNDSVFALRQDHDGQLWVGTHNGVNRLDPATGRIERFVTDPEDPDSLPGQWIMAIHEDEDGYLWFATVGAGLARLDPERATFRHYPVDPGDLQASANVAYAIAEDATGALWIGTATGVYRLDREAGLFHEVPVADLETNAAEPPIVTSLAFDDSGILWIATWTQGMVAFDPASGTSRSYRHDPAQRSGLGSNRIGIVRVHGDDIWLGTWGAGIHRFSAASGIFVDLVPPESEQPTLNQTEVTAVLEDRSGRIWMGTLVDGLIRYDPDGAWHRYLKLPDDSARIGTVFSLAEGPDGTIWIGTNGSLLRLGPGGEELDTVGGWPDRDDSIIPDAVTAMLVDRDGRLWIGLTDGSVYHLSDGGRSFVRYGQDLTDAPGLGDTNISTMFEDRDGHLWFGTRSGGLNRLDPSSGVIERFPSVPDDPHSLSHHHVSSIVRGKDGVLSVGTVGGGINRLVSSVFPGTFEHLSVADGLVNPNVTAMLEDDDGSLWIATRQGLSRLEPGSGRIRNYLLGDGIRSLEFNQGAAFAGRDTLQFGTMNGLVSIRRGTPFALASSAPVRIIGIGLGGRPWEGPMTPWSTDRIEIDYGEHLNLEFAVLDYSAHSRYQYRLGTDHANWTDLGEHRSLTFAELPPGSHALEARGRNAHGLWSDSPARLEIVVEAPIWMAAWFRGSIVAVLVVAVVLGYKRRTSTLKRRNAELMALQRAREAALEEAKLNQEALHQSYDRVRALANRLEEAKEEERAWIARELHDQMGQALSAAKLDLKTLGRLPDGPQREERLRDALDLIDDMIRHVRSLTLDLRPPLLEELGLVMTLRSYADGQATRTGVAVDVEANDEASDLSPAIAIVAFRIVQEAVNNVIRHASATRVVISVRRGAGSLAVTVLDDGHGFDVEATLARAGLGGHLGLLGMQERIEALGGRLEVRSGIGSGTEIRAVVPLDD